MEKQETISKNGIELHINESIIDYVDRHVISYNAALKTKKEKFINHHQNKVIILHIMGIISNNDIDMEAHKSYYYH